MTLRLPMILAEAGALFRRDRSVLLRIAGPLMFLPLFGLQLFVPAPPPPPASSADEAVRLAWADAAAGWLGSWGGWYLLAYALLYWGAATIVSLYADRAAATVGDALGRAARLLPRYLLAMLVLSTLAGAGLLVFVLPGLYVLGRLMLAGPVLVAERPIGAGKAIGRAVRLSRGQGLTLMGVAGASVLVKWVGGSPLLLADAWLRAGENSAVLIALVAGAAAAVIAAAEVGLALCAVVAYRRLARNGI